MASAKPDYHQEDIWRHKGYVIGVDEAGRGPWAGPVCAAAFWIDPRQLEEIPPALTDSKKLTALRRQTIEQSLISSSHYSHAAFAEVAEIDEIGILKATFLAMARSVDALAQRLSVDDPLGLGQVSMVLVDGNLLPPLSYEARAIIKGDSQVLSIAAASIIAKETRDRHMAELARAYPHYGWEKNQGYGTKAHQEGLAAYGVTPHHRTSFAPIRKLIEQS